MFAKKIQYHYFVSGFCFTKPFMTQVTLSKKVSSYNDIEDIRKECAWIYEVEYDETAIVISNYKLLNFSRYS